MIKLIPGGVCAAKGFTAAGIHCGIRKNHSKRDLALIVSQQKATAAAVKPEGPTASERFKWFYANQMKPAFTTALDLLRDVAKEDAHAADLFATALNRGCQQLMNQLGVNEE